MGTAYVLPTTPNTNTYDSGGGSTYSALGTWETDTDINLVTATAGEILYVVGNSHDDSITMNGTTSDSSYFRLVMPNSGNEPGESRANVLLFSCTATGEVMRVNEDYSKWYQISGQVALNTTTNANYFFGFGNLATTGNRLVGCIVGGSTNSGSGTSRGATTSGSSSAGVGMVLCLMENNDGTGYRFTGGSGHYVYNCQSIGGGDLGYETTLTGDPKIINSLASDNTNGGWGGSGTFNSSSDYNAGEDTSPPGSNSRQNQTFTFTSAGSPNFDYRITTGDSGAKDHGVSLASDGTFAFDQDILDTAFSTWDIGFYEPGVAAGGPPPRILMPIRSRLHLLVR